MFERLHRHKPSPAGLVASSLFNESTFYAALYHDLNRCSNEVFLESPFITYKRAIELLPIFRKLRKRGVTVVINTRDPSEHDQTMAYQAAKVINQYQDAGIIILYTGKLHRKLAVLDRSILWEGSLNVLSQGDSCELMRRTESAELASDVISFIRLSDFIR